MKPCMYKISRPFSNIPSAQTAAGYKFCSCVFSHSLSYSQNIYWGGEVEKQFTYWKGDFSAAIKSVKWTVCLWFKEKLGVYYFVSLAVICAFGRLVAADTSEIFAPLGSLYDGFSSFFRSDKMGCEICHQPIQKNG